MENTLEVQQVIADKKGQALASLILGLVGIIAWILPIIGLPVTIIGLVLGIIGRKSSRKTMAIVGIILCIVFLLASIANAAIGVYLYVNGLNPLFNAN